MVRHDPRRIAGDAVPGEYVLVGLKPLGVIVAVDKRVAQEADPAVAAGDQVFHRLDRTGIGFVADIAHLRAGQVAVDQHGRDFGVAQVVQLVRDRFGRHDHHRVAAALPDGLQQCLGFRADPVQHHGHIEVAAVAVAGDPVEDLGDVVVDQRPVQRDHDADVHPPFDALGRSEVEPLDHLRNLAPHRFADVGAVVHHPRNRRNRNSRLFRHQPDIDVFFMSCHSQCPLIYFRKLIMTQTASKSKSVFIYFRKKINFEGIKPVITGISLLIAASGALRQLCRSFPLLQGMVRVGALMKISAPDLK